MAWACDMRGECGHVKSGEGKAWSEWRSVVR